MNEVWKQIPQEPLYEINESGVVRHAKLHRKPLKISSNGRVTLNNRRYIVSVLVEELFGKGS